MLYFRQILGIGSNRRFRAIKIEIVEALLFLKRISVEVISIIHNPRILQIECHPFTISIHLKFTINRLIQYFFYLFPLFIASFHLMYFLLKLLVYLFIHVNDLFDCKFMYLLILLQTIDLLILLSFILYFDYLFQMFVIGYCGVMVDLFGLEIGHYGENNKEDDLNFLHVCISNNQLINHVIKRLNNSIKTHILLQNLINIHIHYINIIQQHISYDIRSTSL